MADEVSPSSVRRPSSRSPPFGYYPVSARPLLLVVFLVGLVAGWLADRRGTLLATGIAHGSVG